MHDSHNQQEAHGLSDTKRFRSLGSVHFLTQPDNRDVASCDNQRAAITIQGEDAMIAIYARHTLGIQFVRTGTGDLVCGRLVISG